MKSRPKQENTLSLQWTESALNRCIIHVLQTKKSCAATGLLYSTLNSRGWMTQSTACKHVSFSVISVVTSFHLHVWTTFIMQLMYPNIEASADCSSSDIAYYWSLLNTYVRCSLSDHWLPTKLTNTAEETNARHTSVSRWSSSARPWSNRTPASLASRALLAVYTRRFQRRTSGVSR